ncbi:MAG: Uma2 family endonuclease [Candidatus Eremiobacteraeota bacterium]|nr:Uma2 family endonuclease [Candidatus Eremiobacteraeota bacterium]
MLAHRQPRLFSHREYLTLEQASETRSEYYRGQIFAMTGGSVEHNQLVRNLTIELGQALRGGPCQVFVSDLRLFVASHDLFTYPDLFVVCGSLSRLEGRTDTLTDAKLIVEVLSPSTEVYDRGEKFLFYQSLPSLSEYLLVGQQPRVERRTRTGPGEWQTTVLEGLEQVVELVSVGVTLKLADLYRDVELNSSTQERAPQE